MGYTEHHGAMHVFTWTLPYCTYAGMYCQLRFKEHLSDDNDVELPEPVPPNKERVEKTLMGQLEVSCGVQMNISHTVC